MSLLLALVGRPTATTAPTVSASLAWSASVGAPLVGVTAPSAAGSFAWAASANNPTFDTITASLNWSALADPPTVSDPGTPAAGGGGGGGGYRSYGRAWQAPQKQKKRPTPEEVMSRLLQILAQNGLVIVPKPAEPLKLVRSRPELIRSAPPVAFIRSDAPAPAELGNIFSVEFLALLDSNGLLLVRGHRQLMRSSIQRVVAQIAQGGEL